MNSLTSKQIRELTTEFSPSPGFILNLSRKQFSQLIEDTIDVDIWEDETSNAKRFVALLKSCTDEQVTALINALRAL